WPHTSAISMRPTVWDYEPASSTGRTNSGLKEKRIRRCLVSSTSSPKTSAILQPSSRPRSLDRLVPGAASPAQQLKPARLDELAQMQLQRVSVCLGDRHRII